MFYQNMETMDIFRFFCLVLLFNLVSGNGQIGLSMLSYTNDGGRLETGECCDALPFVSWCSSPCDTFLDICVDAYNDSLTCDIGQAITGPIMNKNDIEFGDDIGGTPNPILIPFEEWPEEGINININVWDKDVKGAQFIESAEMPPIYYPTGQEGQAIPFHYSGIVIDLFLSLRAYCDPDYYRYNCGTYCKEPDSTDHYYCGLDGDKQCHPGWSGEDCDVDINECDSSPCKHGGTCWDMIDAYNCVCPEGYDGINCGIITDFCVTQPCYNGGECISEGLGYTCECAPGYQGLNCEVEIDACDSSPCENGATCQRDGSSYICQCVLGYTGENCTEEAQSHGKILFQFVSYNNPDGTGDNGNCCDGYAWCTSRCDPYFQICLDKPDGENSIFSCAVGTHTTDYVKNQNDIEFANTIGQNPNPLEYKISKLFLGGFLVKIDVWDHDGSSNDDFIEYFQQDVPLMSANITQEIVFYGRTELTVEMTVVCDPFYYGLLCTTYCEDDPSGQYVCGEDGEKICIPGWHGRDCDQPNTYKD